MGLKIFLKMKKLIFLFGFLFLALTSCTKNPINIHGSLLLTGIQGTKGTSIVSIDLDSGMVVSTTPISCYVFGSTIYDPCSGGYGYVGCDTVFRLVNPVTGNLIKSFKLPGNISQVVIDSKDNVLIGRYSTISYEDDPDTVDTKVIRAGAPVYTNYVIRVNLETGAIVSENQVNIGDGAYACSYFYDQEEKGYVLLRADNKFITINPSTGTVVKTVNIGEILNNVVYRPDNKTIIGLTYSLDADRNYIEVFNAETGVQISKKEIIQRDNYYSCISGYDSESNCYLSVNYPQNEVLFINISTGEIEKTYKLDVPMNDIRFWRK
jgi:glutamine cyclotransferase